MNTQTVIPPWQHGRDLPAFASWPLPTMTRGNPDWAPIEKAVR